jgi:hypothetical protein
VSAVRRRPLSLPSPLPLLVAAALAACGSAPPPPPATAAATPGNPPPAEVGAPAANAADRAVSPPAIAARDDEAAAAKPPTPPPAAAPDAADAAAAPVPPAAVAFTPPRLQLPPRHVRTSGSALAAQWGRLPLAERELRVCAQFTAGNVPARLADLAPVTISEEIDGEWRTVTVWVTPDYFAIGTDEDDLRMPLSPASAQWLCDQLDCALPTPRLVDAIWLQARHKVTPQPISPKQHDIASLPVFAMHDRMVDAQTAREAGDALVAGHKKDVVLSTLLQEWPDRVVLYGWHRLDGTPIQPKSKAHTTPHVDYSHGIRLVSRTILLDGAPTKLDAVLADPKLCALLSDEGPLPAVRYPAAPAADGGGSGR